MTPDLEMMVRDELMLGGYDGLYNEERCACTLDNLFLCGEPTLDCTAGWRTTCGECADSELCDGPGEGYSICATRPKDRMIPSHD